MLTEIEALQETLDRSMPVAGRLGVEAVSFAEGRLTLRAPLTQNLNDKGTAFAGSLAMLATLTGWSLVWLLLRQHDASGDIVLQDSSVRYRRPITGDFEAVVVAPPDDDVRHLLESLRRRGKGRLRLEVQVGDREGASVSFIGRYVVSRPVVSA